MDSSVLEGGGGESVEDAGRSGYLKDTTAKDIVKVVHILVMYDKRRNLRSIAREVGKGFGAVLSILIDVLGKSKVLARWARSIFLVFSCLPMKMTPVILSSEL